MIIPSTNTAVEYDLQRLVAAGLRGVTWHPGRFFVEHTDLSDDDKMPMARKIPIFNDFSDEAIDPLDRMLFTFAAYNAGPGNTARAACTWAMTCSSQHRCQCSSLAEAAGGETASGGQGRA